MTNKQILHADVPDILFEHRNKQYGAYVIRKTYSKRLSLSLLSALVIVSVFLFSFFFKNQNNNRSAFHAVKDSVVIRIFIVADETTPPPPPPTPPETMPITRSDYQPIVIVPDNLADDIVEISDLTNMQISNENSIGIPADDVVRATEVIADTNKNSGNNNDVTGDYTPIEKQPSFPGSTEAWLSFLRRFLQAPEELEPVKRIDVLVRFWIDVDGSISRLEIIKSGGPSFDREVLRVMKKMPRWEPAIQNGRKVAVAYMQPVSFLSVEV